MLAGLCSVTYRDLTPAAVIESAARSGVDVIEWGGDVHVPPTEETATALMVGSATAAAGMVPASYGSYLRCDPPPDPGRVEMVCDTAAALGATGVRVWATGTDVERVATTLSEMAVVADGHGLTISVECHPGTLTEHPATSVALLRSVERRGARVTTYWQPNHRLDDEANLAALEATLPWLKHLHVFTWAPNGDRLPLVDGEPLWRAAFDRIAAYDASESRGSDVAPIRVAFLEFVPDDDPGVLRREVGTLRQWIT